MKATLSSIDLYFLVRELKQLEGLRLDKIYQLDTNHFLFQFQNKKYLVIRLPGQASLASKKPETPERLKSKAAELRKIFGNQKLNKIEQVRSERILHFAFSKNELWIELFGQGRIITNKDYKPPESLDTFNLSDEEFVNVFVQSKDNVSKTLAVKFGLGKKYANELCQRANTSPQAMPDTVSAEKLHAQLKELLKEKTSARLVYDNSHVLDATPIPLKTYANHRNKPVSSFSEALNKIFEVKKPSPYDKELEKINTMISIQEKNLHELENKAQEEQRKAEFIYEHYQELKQLLDSVKKAREKDKLSWDEIKKQFSNIKEVNKKTQEIIVEF